MKKFLKIFLIVILVLLVIIILIPVIFKGKIIDMAQEEANKNLNAKVEFADLKVSLIKNFPNISAELIDLSVVGVDTFQNDTLVRFDRFKTTLDLFSVISGDEIKVKKILLENANVHIKILHDSTANYDIAIEDTTAVEETVSEEESEESNFKLRLDKFEIKEMNVIYDDKAADVYAETENLNFSLKGDLTEDLTNLNMLLTIDSVTVKSGGIKYLNKAGIMFDSEVEADIKNSVYTFKENDFKINEIKLGFDGFVKMPEEDIITDLTFETKETQFKDVLSMVPAVYLTDFEGVETSGEFKFDGYVKGSYNDTIMPAYGINLWIKNGYFKYPELPSSVKNIFVDLKVDAKEGSGDDMTIDLKKANLIMAGNPVGASVFADMTAYDVTMDGNVKGKVDLNKIKDIVPLDDTDLSGIIEADLSFKGKLSDIENENYEKFDAKGNVILEKIKADMTDMPAVNIKKADMAFSPQYVVLKKFNATVGKSDLNLTGRIDNVLSYVFKDELLTGRFDFRSDLIDLNELAGSTEESETPEEEPAEELASSSESDEVIEIPGNLDFTLQSKLKKVLYEELTIDDIDGIIILKDSKLDMRQLKMKLLGGSMNISGSYDTKNPEIPKADFSMAINKFDIPEVFEAFELIKQYVPIAENCEGNISANISLNTILGTDMVPIFSTLNSSGSLNSNNISIKESKLMSSLANKTKQEKFRSPKVKDFGVSYKITDGNLVIEESNFEIAGTNVSFGGTQKLDKSIDFDLGMNLPENTVSGLVKNLPISGTKKDVDVNAKIGGTVTDPKIVGFSSSLTGDVKEVVEEKIEEVKENVKEKADEILKEARNKADLIIKEAEDKARIIRENADKAGQQLISEAEKQGDKLIKEANNPIAKKAAEITKKELVDNAKKQAKNLKDKADNEADNLIKAANEKADKIMKDANDKVDKL